MDLNTTINGVKFVNLTPHTINVVTDKIGEVVIPASGQVARVESHSVPLDSDGGVFKMLGVHTVTFGEVVGLPSPVESVVYVVSGMVLDAMAGSGRVDLLAPGALVRDESGQPIGCRGLRTNFEKI